MDLHHHGADIDPVILEIWIPGNPFPKERPRVTKYGTRTPQKTLDAEANILRRVQHSVLGPVEGPLRLTLHFDRADKRGCDLDNLVKVPLDAMNKVIYADDKQIEAITATMVRGVGAAKAGTYIKVERLLEPLSRPTMR